MLTLLSKMLNSDSHQNNNLMMLNERKGILVQELSENKNKIEQCREKLSRLKEEFASCTSRIESLRELLFDESTKELLSGDLSFHMLAPISDVIEVESEYEKSIESVLSEKVNSFLLPSMKDIQVAVSALKEKRLGRPHLYRSIPI